MFWRKRFGSIEYEDLLRRIIALEIEKDKVYNMMNSMRGLINRKVLGKEDKESEDIKGNVLLPHDHGLT